MRKLILSLLLICGIHSLSFGQIDCENQAYRAINRVILKEFSVDMSKARTSKENSFIYGQNLIYVEVEIKNKCLKVLRYISKYDIPELRFSKKYRDKDLPKCGSSKRRFHFVVAVFHDKVSEKHRTLKTFVEANLADFVSANNIPSNFEINHIMGTCSHCSWKDVPQ